VIKVFLIILLFENLVFGKQPPPVSSIVQKISPSVVVVKGERITKMTKDNMFIVGHTYRIGSGFIIDENGYIITANHIVSDSDTIYVELKSGKGYNAKMIKKDLTCDVALIKIDERKLPSVNFGNPRNVRAGDPIIIIGNPMPKQVTSPPFSFSHSVACGVIASTERVSSNNKKLFQLTVPVNFGNSGCPLINQFGEVIGVVNFKMTGFAGHHLEGVGFALFIDEIKSILNILNVEKKEVQEVFYKREKWIIYLNLSLLFLLSFLLVIKIKENRWKNYDFVKKEVYKTVYKGNYGKFSSLIKRVIKDGLHLEKLIGDLVLFKEPWVLLELNNQLQSFASSLDSKEQKMSILKYQARIKRILREEIAR